MTCKEVFKRERGREREGGRDGNYLFIVFIKDKMNNNPTKHNKHANAIKITIAYAIKPNGPNKSK